MKFSRLLSVLPLLMLAGCNLVVMSPSGDIASQQADLILVSTFLMLLIIVPVLFLTLFFAWRYRRSNTSAKYDPEWHHSTRLEVVIWSAPLAIIIALMGITNTLALSIFERTRELGVLRALGMTRGQLKTTVRFEAIIISLFGTILGLSVGVFFGWAVVQALSDEGISTLAIPVPTLAIVTTVAAIAGVAASVLPGRRASRLDVLEAIAS
jgi:hypothetical protein